MKPSITEQDKKDLNKLYKNIQKLKIKEEQIFARALEILDIPYVYDSEENTEFGRYLNEKLFDVLFNDFGTLDDVLNDMNCKVEE